MSSLARIDFDGRPRSALDTIIAAIAEANGCVVVTDNEKDFADAYILDPLGEDDAWALGSSW